MTAGVERALYQQLRLALVFNGGVSLAVWMGGVAKELDRFRSAFYRSDAAVEPYAGLLDAVQTEVLTDVIAGTSAGGINGAMLGFVVGNGRALETAGQEAGTDAIRAVWEKLGAIDQLLDEKGAPASALNEDFLFQGCANVFAMLGAHSELTEEVPTRMRLTVTATDSRGYPVDVAGVSGRDHRLEMKFRAITYPSGADVLLDASVRAAITTLVGEDCGEEWPFPPPDASARELAGPGAPALLARAARTTAAFPFAFGPSQLPMSGSTPALVTDQTGLTATPCMREVITTRGSAGALDDEPNRYAIDGGIWDNAPFEAVLRSIDREPAGRDVDRRLVYVVYSDQDLSGDDGLPPATDPTKPPPLTTAFRRTLAMPSDVSFANDVERIRRDTIQQTRRRDRLAWLLSEGEPDVFKLAPELLPLYAQRARDEQCANLVPSSFPPTQDRTEELPPKIQDLTAEQWRITPDDWAWDVRPVQVAIETGRRLIRQVLRLLAADGAEAAALVQQMIKARETLSQLAWALSDLQDRREARALDDDERIVCGCVMAQFAASVRELHDPLVTLMARRGEDAIREPLQLAVRLTAGDSDLIIKRAIATEIAMHALDADDRPHKVDYRFETIRPDPSWPLPPDDDPSPAPGGTGSAPPRAGDPPSRPPLAGIRYGHFGGFLLESWRLSDWMWGRLDGCRRVVDMLLDGSQFERLTAGRPDACEELATKLAELAIPVGEGIDRKRTHYLGYCAYASHGLIRETGAPSDPRDGTQDLSNEQIQGWRRRLAQTYAETIAGTPSSGDPPADLKLLRADVGRRIQYAILDDERPGLVKQMTAERADVQLRVEDTCALAPLDADALAERLDGGLSPIVNGLFDKLPTIILVGYAERAAANALGALNKPKLATVVRDLGRATHAVEALEHAKYAVAHYIFRRHRDPQP